MGQRKDAYTFAVCINNADYPASLEVHKIYRVLPDQDAAIDGDIRVVDESGEDYLYPPSISSLWSCQGQLKSLYCELLDPPHLALLPGCSVNWRSFRGGPQHEQ